MKLIFRRALLAVALLLSAAQLEAQQKVNVRPVSMTHPGARQAALAVDLILSGSKTATEAFLTEFGSTELHTSPAHRASLDDAMKTLGRAPLKVLGVYRVAGAMENALLVRLSTGTKLAPTAVLVQLEGKEDWRIRSVRAVQVAET